MSLKLVKHAAEFAEILRIIHAGRARAFEAVNVALIDTYWAVSEPTCHARFQRQDGANSTT